MAATLGAWNAARALCETEVVFLRTKAEAVSRVGRLSDSWHAWCAVACRRRAAEVRRRASRLPSAGVLGAAPERSIPTAGEATGRSAHSPLRIQNRKWQHQERAVLRMSKMLAKQEKALEDLAMTLLAAERGTPVDGRPPPTPDALHQAIDAHFAEVQASVHGKAPAPASQKSRGNLSLQRIPLAGSQSAGVLAS